MQAPTPEMVAFFEQRTHEHIERVGRCLLALAKVLPCGNELRERAHVHDASKFGPEERIPYIWLTEFHRCRREGIEFQYPPGVEAAVCKAVQHHLTTNRHHPEAHDEPNAMTEGDLIEMVCDWTAMAQEFGEAGGSARPWAEKTIGARLQLSDERRRFVFAMIDLLDAQLAENH